MNKHLIFKLCPKCKVQLNDQNNTMVYSICDDCEKKRKRLTVKRLNKETKKMQKVDTKNIFAPFLNYIED